MPWKMTPDELFRRVRDAVAEQASVDPESVTAETHFTADLNFDSLDFVEFVMKLEDSFQLSVPDERAEEVRKVGTVGAAARMLQALQNGDETQTGPAQPAVSD